MKCDFCFSTGECFSECDCSKCLDPKAYEEWKTEFPEEYEAWLEEKRYEDFDLNDC